MELRQLGIVGSETLVGQEVRRLTEEILPDCDLTGYGAQAEGFMLEAEGDEAAISAPLNKEALERLDLAFLAAPGESGRRIYQLARSLKRGPTLIDLTGSLEDFPETRLLAPMLEGDQAPPSEARLYAVAHPAATSLALALSGCARYAAVSRCIVHVFEPVSERGQAGVNELQRQTVALLSFHSVPKQVFDAQVSFNLLPRYGPKAAEQLSSVELRIEKHLATLLGRMGPIPMPSLRVCHAPVFHNYTMSVWVEFDRRPPLGELASSLAGPWIRVQSANEDPVSNATVSGSSGVVVTSLEGDRNDPHAVWFWLAADNLRMAAENAVLAAKALLPHRGAEGSR